MKKYCTFPNNDTFDFWIENNLNVLFFGKHGVGKTSMIIEAFNRNNIKHQMFSASTMDPWVDFIGVPKEQHDERGAYLELIRPKSFRDDEIEALFFDELNRSHKKIRNAIMELIQFKSINGRKFPNLRFVWGAVNPSDDESVKYDVEELDPAQADRFHVHVEIPYKPYAPYLREKFGRDYADTAIEWWEKLPNKVQSDISPRRLEYAMDLHRKGANLAYILPQNSAIDKLAHNLTHGSPTKKFAELLKNSDEQKIKEFLADENNYDAVQSEIVSFPSRCLHLIAEEKLSALLHKNISVAYYVSSDYQQFKSLIDNLATNSNDKAIRQMMIKCKATNNKEDLFSTDLLRANSIPNSLRYRLDTIKKSYSWNNNAEMVVPKIPNRMWRYNNTSACISHAMAKLGDTNERMRILLSIGNIVAEKGTNIPHLEATSMLKLIELVTSKTQIGTIKRSADYIYSTINICVRILRNAGIIKNIQDFVDAYPHISCKIIYDDGFDPNFTNRCFLKANT